MTLPPTPLHSAPDEEVVLPSEQMPTNDIDLNPELEESDQDTEPSEPRISAWTVPFEEAFRHLKTDFYKKQAEEFLHSQQSRFITYTDGEILQIQRKFIKFQANPDMVYSLETVITEVGRVLDFVWQSVNVKTPLFGQEEYYLRVLGDLEEWLEYYTFPAASLVTFYIKFFNFFQAIDTHLSFLADGFDTADHSVSKLSNTELVRLLPLITRLRLLIISRIGKVLESGHSDVMDLEIGRLFEGLLERV